MFSMFARWAASQGLEGEEVAMPPCARALAPHGDDADGEPAVLVRWHVASPAGAGHFLLLARLAHQLGALRQARLPGPIRARVCGVPASPAGEGHLEDPSMREIGGMNPVLSSCLRQRHRWMNLDLLGRLVKQLDVLRPLVRRCIPVCGSQGFHTPACGHSAFSLRPTHEVAGSCRADCIRC